MRLVAATATCVEEAVSGLEIWPRHEDLLITLANKVRLFRLVPLWYGNLSVCIRDATHLRIGPIALHFKHETAHPGKLRSCLQSSF